MTLLTKNKHKRRWFRIWENIDSGCYGRGRKLLEHYKEELYDLSFKVGASPVNRDYDYSYYYFDHINQPKENYHADEPK